LQIQLFSISMFLQCVILFPTPEPQLVMHQPELVLELELPATLAQEATQEQEAALEQQATQEQEVALEVELELEQYLYQLQDAQFCQLTFLH